MAELRIDVHMHLYETKAAGEREKQAYEIWEYGQSEDVAFSHFAGDLEDAEAAMAEAGYAHAIVANLFALPLLDDAARAGGPGVHRDRLVAFNRWACEIAATRPQFSVFVAADPLVLGGEEGSAHLREMVEHHGARGVKIHPVLQRFLPDDERMHPIYEAAVDLGIPILSHAGAARDGGKWAEPVSFAPVLRRFPGLKLVLAHLGGGAWRQAAEFARTFPQVSFDLCEIVAWAGAPGAPSPEQLAGLIAEVGPQRVMLGTDFPWYDLSSTVDLVRSLPVLSDAAKTAILGENAARILGLPL